MRVNLEQLHETLEHGQPTLMDNTGRYAVLVPLVEGEDGSLSVLYEVRAGTLRRQPGEVCFPGGRIEGDETSDQCALRETFEELAIPAEEVQLLGPLDFLVHRAGFIMYPVLGKVSRAGAAQMRPSPAEVGGVFRVPLEHLLEHPPMEYRCELSPQVGEDFPYERIGIPRSYRWMSGGETILVYPWKDHAIWGLTAKITRCLIRFLKEQG